MHNDIGIVSSLKHAYDAEKCWGCTRKKTRFNLIEKVLRLYKENGRSKERFWKMVDRLGIAWVEKQLVRNDIRLRKEEILQK